MIPAPILAEAREAFTAHGGSGPNALEAALAVLSRHWPAADGRGSEVITEACEWRKRNPGAVAAFELAAVVDRYLAALATPAPAQSVRVVRVAVAEDDDGNVEAVVVRSVPDVAWHSLRMTYGARKRIGIGVVEFLIREVPTVRASVRGAGT